jgi:hypothetical protein
MKRRNLAWALLFLGIGAFIGLAVGRGESQLRVFDRGADRTERVFFEDTIRNQLIEEIVIENPDIPIPPVPPIPAVPPIPSGQAMPHEIVIERGFPFDNVFGLIGGLIRMTSNLLALLLIVIGAVLILRQRNQPVEKAPPETAVKPE